MSAIIIDGALVAERMRADIAQQVAQYTAAHAAPPGLGVVLVGDNPASHQYVRMKRRACEQAGMASFAHLLPQDATQTQVEDAVRQLNDDPRVHGILVQLPLPPQINEERVLRLVSIDKDADGLHPVNIGLLAMKGREPLFTPATPTGCMALLREVDTPISGAHAVVIGRSNIVGMPMALLLLRADATVTVCHSRTKDMPALVRQADIVIAAIGKPEFVPGAWLKPGATVIDVGTNKVDDPTEDKGYRFVGDVHFESASQVARAISKVPGGVGPMTITILMANTMKAALRRG